MKIFVTGGTGFIGSHFINQAHAAGNEIVALRRSTSSKPIVTLDREPTWIEGPIGFRGKSQWEGCDVLVHLAASGITPQPATWEDCYKINDLNQPMIDGQTYIANDTYENANDLMKNSILLGTHQGLSEKQFNHIQETTNSFIAQYT